MKTLNTLLLVALLPFAATAETIRIPVGQQSEQLQNIERPDKGMTKETVKTQFGEPLQVREARGTPPISSWVYRDFIVYFEYDHVIHSVLKHTPTATQEQEQEATKKPLK